MEGESLTFSSFNCLKASKHLMMYKYQKHEEIDKAYILVNDEYKVSMIYGAKFILLEIYRKQYIET